MRHRYLPLLLTAVLAACGDDAGEPTADQLAAREGATRQACAADLLARRAEEELAVLEQLPGSQNIAGFQRAYRQHAILRNAVAARLDSALNHSPTPADSAAHIAGARAIQIRTPDPETVEANVIRSYDENLVTILAEADHPCNWQSELNRDE